MFEYGVNIHTACHCYYDVKRIGKSQQLSEDLLKETQSSYLKPFPSFKTVKPLIQIYLFLKTKHGRLLAM